MALECNRSNCYLNKEQRMVVHVASLLLMDDRGLDMREVAKHFGVSCDDIQRLYDCALVIYDIAGNQGAIKLPGDAGDRCVDMADLRIELGKMVAKIFPGKPQIRIYPETSLPPDRAADADPVLSALARRRPSSDPVANQSYNLWSSVCFIAWLSSLFSGVFILIGFGGMLFFGDQNWAMIGAFVLLLFGSLFLKFAATVHLIRTAENH